MGNGAKPLSELGLTALTGGDVALTGISVDSRLVKPGHLFAALPGTKAHGASFLPAVLEKGAAAILTDREGAEIARPLIVGTEVALVVTEDPRQALAFACALFFGAQPATMIAVTGTNGKTSVATFTRQIWAAMGLEAANIGTTGVEGAYTAPSAHTTPEPVTLHRLLADMAAAGVTHAAMEASSHGLAQRHGTGVVLHPERAAPFGIGRGAGQRRGAVAGQRAPIRMRCWCRASAAAAAAAASPSPAASPPGKAMRSPCRSAGPAMVAATRRWRARPSRATS